MATHSSALAWRIPGMGSHRVGHDWSDLAAAVVRENRSFIKGYSNLALTKGKTNLKRIKPVLE